MYQRASTGSLPSSCFASLSAKGLICIILAVGFLTGRPAAGPSATEILYNSRNGAYFDPTRRGEGILVEMHENGEALVYLFSYDPDGTVGGGNGQTWMIGIGRQVGSMGIEVDELLMPTGGRFGPGFDPDDVVYNRFGSLAFTFPSCLPGIRGDLIVEPPSGTGFGTLASENYVQLTHPLDCVTGEGSPHSHLSGSWYDRSREGEGFVVEVLKDGRALVLWFTYDSAGNQMWIEGVGQLNEAGFVLLEINDLTSYGGARWGAGFDTNDVSAFPFGTLRMEFTGCARATLRYDTVMFGSGTQSLEQFTGLIGMIPSGAGCWDY